MKRIAIFGFSGGGKSTTASRLGEILDIEPTHLDRIHWLPDWKEDTLENKKKKLIPVLHKDKWIIEGNYRNLLWNERMMLADTIIFIDVNRFTCLKNAWLRSRRYKGRTRPDMGIGCMEKFDFEFALWVFINGRKKRKEYLEIIKISEAEGKETYIFKNKKQINSWLDTLKSKG